MTTWLIVILGLIGLYAVYKIFTTISDSNREREVNEEWQDEVADRTYKEYEQNLAIEKQKEAEAHLDLDLTKPDPVPLKTTEFFDPTSVHEDAAPVAEPVKPKKRVTRKPAAKKKKT